MPLGFLGSEISEVCNCFCHFLNSAFEAKISFAFHESYFCIELQLQKNPKN